MNEGNVKQVKVDNWGIFFLQRLQQFFNRSEYCDLILQFSNNDQVKVHRLVLNACTEYFQTLEKQGCNVGACIIRMPADLQSDVVVPIINFMYTGRLEFRTELHTQLYAAAQQMNMTVLTKLLDAQSSPVTQPKPVPVKKPLPVTWNLQGKKIIPKQLDPDLPEPLPGRKLPIWKRRNAPIHPPYGSEPTVFNHDGPSRVLMPKADEIPRPTRFEWPDEDIQPTPPFTSSFDDISYETKPLIKAVDKPKLPTLQPTQPGKCILPAPQPKLETRSVSFEEVRRTAVSIKRPAVSSDPDEAKKPKIMDLQAVKEYIAEHKLRKDLVDNEDSSEDVDDDLAVADMDDDDDDDMEEETDQPEGVLSGPIPSQMNIPQKSILKSQAALEEPIPVSTSTPIGSKKVRFSFDDKLPVGKENSSQEVKPTANKPTSVSVGSVTEPGNLSNHAKIITEVLKKYPHLVKNNKNIRLKIMQRGNQPVAPTIAAETDPNKLVKSKVSYVVLKSEVAGKGKAVVLKHGGHVEPLSELASQQKVASGAENTTGPWLCYTCGSNEEPVNFETYYQYRRHLQDVHMEKIDARICEHCGHRASKRNLLLYHLYTRHNIPPPRNCQFPKCDQCDYVALSESLLIKHRNNHLNNKEFICRVCNATFKSNGALQGHMQTNLHSDPAKKLYECPYCMKPFIRNINLKAHLRTAHKDFRKMDDGAGGQLDEQGLQLPLDSEDGDSQTETTGDENLNMSTAQVGQVMEVPVMNTVPQVKSEVTQSVMLTPTMTVLAEAPSMQTLVPSSEAEALSNVASGIAASLGLADTLSGEQTVIVLDENQEFILHTTEVVREETAFTEAQEYVEENQNRSEEQSEYIVPEIMTTEENQQYTGPLPNVKRYTTENSETLTSNTEHCALPTTQPVVAPPTLPSVNTDGEEIALVLSDHDYAEDTTQKENAPPENTMFIITQPVVSVSNGNTIPVVSGETTQTHVMSALPGNGAQMAVITNIIHDGISVPVSLASSNTAVIIPAICDRTNNSLGEIQQNIIKVETNTSDNSAIILQQNPEVTYVEEAVPERCTEGATETTSIEVQSSNIPCSPVKQSIPVTTMPIRRMPAVQMADLVKEWDDFDEDSCDAKMADTVVQTG